MPRLYIEAPILGIGPSDSFFYMSDRPARHCGICGESYQPELARVPDYLNNPEVVTAVGLLLDEWAFFHNRKHSPSEHLALKAKNLLMTPEAASKLIPLGIYPVSDMIIDEESAQSALEAPRAPTDDVRTF